MGDTTVQTGTPNTQPQGDPAANVQPNAAATTPDTAQGDDALGEGGKKALAAEREARKAEAEARKALEKRLDLLKPFEEIAKQFGGGDMKKGRSEIEQLSERHAQLEQEIRSERDARWRAELAHEYGLTANQAKRLMGATREEMAADAEELVKDFQVTPKSAAAAGNGRPKPDRSQGGGQGQAAVSGKEQGIAMARKRFGDPTKT